LKSIIYKERKSSFEPIQIRYLHCCIALNFIIIIIIILLLLLLYYKTLAVNTDYSANWHWPHKFVSCTYRTWSRDWTCHLPFWVPTVDSNKSWLCVCVCVCMTNQAFILCTLCL